MLRFATSRAFLTMVLFLAGAIALSRWVSAIGGPEALIARYGLWAPALTIPIQAVLAAAPVPSELFALAAAAAYGWFYGACVAWIGWTLGAMIQYGLARRGAVEWDVESRLERLPRWLRRLPVEHPAFLICVRWLPMGFHIANVSAAVRGVPATKQLWTAAVGSIPGALLWASIGAGISIL